MEDMGRKPIVRMLLRVSSNQQLDAEGDLEVQRRIVSDYIKRQDWELDPQKPEYYEGGVSGFKYSVDERQVLQDILNDAKKGEFEILVCYKDDRLGRREDEIPQYIKKLASFGVLVYTVKDECLTPQCHADDLLNFIRYWHAEGSSLDTSLRVKDAAKENVRLGRNQGGNAPYGYKLEYSGEFSKHQRALKKKVIDPERAEVVRYIYDLAKCREYGACKITRILNDDKEMRVMSPNGEVWKAETVRDILRNPIYTGYEAYNRREKKNGHFVRLNPSEWVLSEKCNEEIQIISPDLWEEVQELREERKKKMDLQKECGGHAPTRTSGILALLDVVYCGYCGRKLTNGSKYNYWKTKDGEKRSSVVGYYRCQTRHQSGVCDGKTFYRADTIESKVFEFVMNYLTELEDNTTVLAKLIETEQAQKKVVENSIKKKKKEMGDIAKNIEILKDKIPSALIGECVFSAEELHEQLEKNQKQRQELELQVEGLQKDLNSKYSKIAEIDKFMFQIPKWKEAFQNGTIDERRAIINKIVERIDVWDKKMEIHVRVNLKEFLSIKTTNGVVSQSGV